MEGKEMDTGCEIVKCQWWDGKVCNDPAKYVNENGEAVCGRRDDAIPVADKNYMELAAPDMYEVLKGIVAENFAEELSWPLAAKLRKALSKAEGKEA